MSARLGLNPFPRDRDRREIWEILVRRDVEAYLDCDWAATAADFLPDVFIGIDAGKAGSPDAWRPGFATLTQYRRFWMSHAREFRGVELVGTSKREFLLSATSLRDIDINGSAAIAHKKFDGVAFSKQGERIRLLWQTLYIMRKVRRRWRIAGFVGYLPNPMPSRGASRR